MTTIRIDHRTTYHYREPLTFGAHRMLLRPRESRTLRLISHDIVVSPNASITWANDVFGNAVATATFSAPAATLDIDSTLVLQLDAEQWPVFDIAASAANYPFLLTDDEMTDLGALRLQAYLDAQGDTHAFAQQFIAPGATTNTLALLTDLSAGVAARLTYEVRETDDAQSPSETLACSRGSCRDFAVLFVDAARSLGFGARIVSGYLFDQNQTAIGSSGAGSTHAWAEVYVPGAGWIVFDPTNRSVGGFNLIPVAVARHIRQIMPISGSFIGPAEAFERLDVAIEVGAV